MHKNEEKGLNIIDIMIFRDEGMFQGRGREREGQREGERDNEIRAHLLCNFSNKTAIHFFCKKLLIFFLYSIVVEVKKVIRFHILDIYMI